MIELGEILHHQTISMHQERYLRLKVDWTNSAQAMKERKGITGRETVIIGKIQFIKKELDMMTMFKMVYLIKNNAK